MFTTGAVSLYLIKKWLWRQQLKISEQQFVKEQIKRRFTQTQQDALYTIYELIPVLSLVLAKDLDVDEIVGHLKGKKMSKHILQDSANDAGEFDGLSSGMSTSVADPQGQKPEVTAALDPTTKTKAELWNELKLKSLTKLCTVIYNTSSLLLLTRLQLNILARREYLDTAVKVAVDKSASSQSSIGSWLSGWWNQDSSASTESDQQGPESAKLSAEAQQARRSNYINEQAFLSFSWWLLNRGWLQFKNLAETLVERHFGDLSPRDMLTVEEFGARLSNVLHAMNEDLLVAQTDPIQPLQTILLPDSNLEQFVLQQTLDSDALKVLYDDNTVLRQLLNETTKCIQSTASLIVLESLVNDAFQFSMNQVAENVSKKGKHKTDSNASGSHEEPAFQMALFSITCKNCCDEMLKSGVVSMNNVFLQSLDSIAELDDLSASVYSNFGF